MNFVVEMLKLSENPFLDFEEKKRRAWEIAWSAIAELKYQLDIVEKTLGEVLKRLV